MNQVLKKIETLKAPKAIGPYSQAIVSNGGQSLVFVSGQLPIDPQTGKLMEGDIRVLTNRVIENIQEILLAAGSRLENVVRVDIFLIDLKKDFSLMNEEYSKHFSSTAPARQTVQVSALPLGSPIEISCIAIVV